MINRKQMMNQLQKAQQLQKELETSEFVGTAGGGIISVRVNGKKEVINVLIDKEAIQEPSDVEMLEEAIIAAFSDAFKKVDKKQEELFGPMMGGMGGLF